MRTPLIAGNWKMNTTLGEAQALVADLLKLRIPEGREVLVCPPFISLAAVADRVRGSGIQVGAQNMYTEASGAFTGEIAPPMLTDLGCTYVILGHSERRQYFGETNVLVREKVEAAFAHGLIPIVCVGESEAQRESGETVAHITEQVTMAVQGLPIVAAENLVFAYEPIWAIGTGKTATKEQAQEVCSLIRKVIASLQNEAVASAVRILYGGSVKASNIDELMAEEDIDGALVGGASLKANDFAGIIAFKEA